jgi:hypothetical protein
LGCNTGFIDPRHAVAWQAHGDTVVQITYAVAKLKGDTVRCVVDASTPGSP